MDLKTDLKTDLQNIQKPVMDLLAQTNGILIEKVKSDIRLLKEIGKMTPVSKGKKIRSTLLFLLAGMTNLNSRHLPEIAAYIEMFHLSSLIHDDIMDNSELRRGEKTLNNYLGNFQSVLWGDYLFINSFAALHKIGNAELLATVFDAARLMIEGQLQEVENNLNFDLPLDTYYDIINRKTSSLFAAVSRIAALLDNRDAEQADAFYRFGLDFGAIFQISDDMLDIFSKKSGKDRFRDLEEGKITLPVILLLEESDTDIKDHFAAGNREKLLELCEAYNIKELCMKKIDGFYHQCLDFLAPFPDSVYKESLFRLLEFIKYREY